MLPSKEHFEHRNAFVIDTKTDEERMIYSVFLKPHKSVSEYYFPQFYQLRITVWRMCAQVKHEGLEVILNKKV